MKIEAWIDGGNGLQPPVRAASARQIVIRDEYDQPFMVLIQQSKDRIWLVKQGDSDFKQALASLGIDPFRAEVQSTRQDLDKLVKFP